MRIVSSTPCTASFLSHRSTFSFLSSLSGFSFFNTYPLGADVLALASGLKVGNPWQPLDLHSIRIILWECVDWLGLGRPFPRKDRTVLLLVEKWLACYNRLFGCTAWNFRSTFLSTLCFAAFHASLCFTGLSRSRSGEEDGGKQNMGIRMKNPMMLICVYDASAVHERLSSTHHYCRRWSTPTRQRTGLPALLVVGQGRRAVPLL